MAVVKGMLVEKNGRRGVLMTPSGQFVKVLLPNTAVELGTEIEGKVWRLPHLGRTMLAAAVVMLVLLVPAHFYLLPAQAVAYVALDINPSIELGIDKNMIITETRGLDTAGKKLVAEVNVQGVELSEAISKLVARAISEGYISTEQDNVVLSTLTVTDQKQAAEIDKAKIKQMISRPIENNRLPVRVVIEEIDSASREEAQKAGLSTGKYLLYKKAREEGLEVTIDEVRQSAIWQLERQKDFRTEQLLRDMPPGQAKVGDRGLTAKTFDRQKNLPYGLTMDNHPAKPEKRDLQNVNHFNWAVERSKQIKAHKSPDEKKKQQIAEEKQQKTLEKWQKAEEKQHKVLEKQQKAEEKKQKTLEKWQKTEEKHKKTLEKQQKTEKKKQKSLDNKSSSSRSDKRKGREGSY